MSTPKIIYTKTDEAPALATYSLLPIVRAFTRKPPTSTSKRATSRWRDASLPPSRNA
jgi:isocitrate dehydrogenase